MTTPRAHPPRVALARLIALFVSVGFLAFARYGTPPSDTESPTLFLAAVGAILLIAAVAGWVLVRAVRRDVRQWRANHTDPTDYAP